MEVNYELTQRDFFESLIAHRNRKKWVKWSFRVFITVAIIFAGLSLFVAAMRPSAETLSNLFPFLGLVGLWCLLMWGSPWWLARTQFLKQPSAQGRRRALFDGDGIHWRWDGGSSEVEWKSYVRWMETRNEILLYTSPVLFGIVPKRALTPEQLSELRTLLTQNIGAGLRV